MWCTPVVAACLGAALLGGACGGNGATSAVDAGDAAGDSMMGGPDAGGGPDSSGESRGLIVTFHSVSPLPFTDGQGTTISTAALWFSRISFISDQGQSTAAELRSLPFVAAHGAEGQDPELMLPTAPPGLYSLARVQLASADGAPLPKGFAEQPLAIRTTGMIDPHRSFTISDADSGSVDLRAAAPMELKAGSLLHVIIDVDVSQWLTGLSFDHGDSSEPFVVGPDGDGGFRDDFRGNVLRSLAVRLAP